MSTLAQWCSGIKILATSPRNRQSLPKATSSNPLSDNCYAGTYPPKPDTSPPPSPSHTKKSSSLRVSPDPDLSGRQLRFKVLLLAQFEFLLDGVYLSHHDNEYDKSNILHTSPLPCWSAGQRAHHKLSQQHLSDESSEKRKTVQIAYVTCYP